MDLANWNNEGDWRMGTMKWNGKIVGVNIRIVAGARMVLWAFLLLAAPAWA